MARGSFCGTHFGGRGRSAAAMKECDIVVIGAGVAGLAAAGELARGGFYVRVIEARGRVGGRVWTVRPRGWSGPVELGAEFIHGGNDALWAVVKRARVKTRRTPGKHWLAREDGIEAAHDIAERIARVTEQIAAKRMTGWSFARFLKRAARDLERDDRELAASFVEGFEAAPMDEMSAAALEGESPDDAEQFIVPDGYESVVQQLAEEAVAAGAEFWLESAVTRVRWTRGGVSARVRTSDGGEEMSARAAVVTLPIGVWQAGAVKFEPALRAKERAAAGIGNGQVVRMTWRLEARRWRALRTKARKPAGTTRFGFIHSRVAGVPVWWSLTDAPVLTGWAGGPAAEALSKVSDAEVRRRAEESLAKLLGVSAAAVRGVVRDAQMHRWDRDAWSRGAYSFTKAGHEAAAGKLREPVRGTLFFAGEATADGEEVGTVHGALSSGLRAAREVADFCGRAGRKQRGEKLQAPEKV